MKSLAIGSDHAGFKLKEIIKQHLASNKIEVKDYGTYSEDRADYPDFAHAVSKSIEAGTHDLGILICGSANGISMAANKHSGIRSAVCWKPEIAELARQHNDANILALPARFIDEELALKCVDSFLSASFEGGRHATRVDKIPC